MKRCHHTLFALASLCLAPCFFAAPSVSAQGNTAPAVAPAAEASNAEIHFAGQEFDFGKAQAGEKVRHTYYFTNSGTSTLIIKNVQTSCGCTTPGQYSKEVPAGQSGEIPVEFNSANYNGPVTKTITVTSNAKNAPSVPLQLKGTVWKPVDINPTYAVINITPDADRGSFSVLILNHEETPLEVYEPTVSNPGVTAEIQTNTPGKEYHVLLSTRGGSTRSFQTMVKLRTSNPKMPDVTITVFVNVQQALMASPGQISLPPGPIERRLAEVVTFVNNSTNPVTLSEPSINAPFKILTNNPPPVPLIRPPQAPPQPAPAVVATPPEEPGENEVGIAIKEVQPGRMYMATLTFPPGFEANKGQQVEFTIKTSNPKMPELKVPIMQYGAPRGGPISRPPARANVPPRYPPGFGGQQPAAPPVRPPAPNINVPPSPAGASR